MIVAVEIAERCEVSSVGDCADVKVLALFIEDISEGVHGGCLMRFLYQVDKKFF